MHGTAARRPIKCVLHIFPNEFWSVFGRQNAQKELQQQKTLCAGPWFSICFSTISCRMYTGLEPQRPTRSGELNNNILIVIILFNHLIHGPPRFLPIRSSSRRGLPPPLRGGSSLSKESPVLPIPSYPALCREDATSWNDGRPRTLRARMHDRLCGPMLLLQSPPAPRTTSNRPLARDVVCAKGPP